MLLVYNLALILLSPLWVPWMLARSRSRKEPPNWAERFGIYKLKGTRSNSKRLWFHAVSVGEVIASSAILKELRAQAPDVEILLSVTTSSGHQTAREQYPNLFDHLVYFPLDLPLFQLRSIASFRPHSIAIMETELWLNFLWAAKQHSATTMVLNGRFSDKSFASSAKLRSYYRTLFKYLDRVLCQSQTDADRMVVNGALGRVEVLGNCKFDQAGSIVEEAPEETLKWLGLETNLPLVVIGSTRDEHEEKFVAAALNAVKEKNLDFQVLWAPRHPERADQVAEKLKESGFEPKRRSLSEQGPCLILDTFGELGRSYNAADLVIIGGGFSNLGGQNLIQPLAYGCPVLHGPHMQNFREATEMALEAGASQCCSTSEELSATVIQLLTDPTERKKRGEAALQVIRPNLGASKRYADQILDSLNHR